MEAAWAVGVQAAVAWVEAATVVVGRARAGLAVAVAAEVATEVYQTEVRAGRPAVAVMAAEAPAEGAAAVPEVEA